MGKINTWKNYTECCVEFTARKSPKRTLTLINELSNKHTLVINVYNQ